MSRQPPPVLEPLLIIDIIKIQFLSQNLGRVPNRVTRTSMIVPTVGLAGGLPGPLGLELLKHR